MNHEVSLPKPADVLPPRHRAKDWVAKVGANHQGAAADRQFENYRRERLGSDNAAYANGTPASEPRQLFKTGQDYRERGLGSSIKFYGEGIVQSANEHNARQAELQAGRIPSYQDLDGATTFNLNVRPAPMKTQAGVNAEVGDIVKKEYGKDVKAGAWAIGRRAVATAAAAGAIAYGVAEHNNGGKDLLSAGPEVTAVQQDTSAQPMEQPTPNSEYIPGLTAPAQEVPVHLPPSHNQQ